MKRVVVRKAVKPERLRIEGSDKSLKINAFKIIFFCKKTIKNIVLLTCGPIKKD